SPPRASRRRCSPRSRCPLCRPSCRCGRSPRSAASSPTRSQPPGACTRSMPSRCSSPTVPGCRCPARAAARRVPAVQAEPVLIADGPGVTLPGPRREEAATVALHDVTFTYPGRARPALSHVSFTVPAGANVALVGPSGAGKTTIASLLLRFWDPASGSITLAGHDLRAWSLDDLRGHIALVAQDTHLFNDTLGGNIRIARPEATDAEVAAAIERASLTPLVHALPEGLETRVGEHGLQLS